MLTERAALMTFTYQCERCATGSDRRRCPRCGFLKDVATYNDIDGISQWDPVTEKKKSKAIRWDGILRPGEWYRVGPDRAAFFVLEPEDLVGRTVLVMTRTGRVTRIETDGAWSKVE